MNFKDYEKELSEIGLKVNGEFITNSRGDVIAQMTPYGGFETKNFQVAHILNQKKTTRKRARTESGQYKADDPSTPDINEAWVEE